MVSTIPTLKGRARAAWVSFCLYFLAAMWCDSCLKLSRHDFLTLQHVHWTVRQNKPCIVNLAFVRYFITAMRKEADTMSREGFLFRVSYKEPRNSHSPIFQMGKRHHRHSQNANKHMDCCLTWLAIIETQRKTTMRSHIYVPEWLKVLKNSLSKSADNMGLWWWDVR